MLITNKYIKLFSRRVRKSLCEFTKPDSTLIIIDWDDTLLPTSWLYENRQVNLLDNSYGALVAQFLQKSLELGKVVIITNASPNWVYQTAELHLKHILPLLKEVPICSARQFSKNKVNDVIFWKYRAFTSVIKYFSAIVHGKKNIISIGDSQWDKDAVFNVFEANEEIDIVPKAIKFITNPSYDLLCDQIIQLTLNLSSIVSATKPQVYEMKKVW
ncbi:hypothetical protein cand_031360 [Cryptosporidium andersoni]|uniref:Uncharacterized protein n=1 Tax=Cryptosporidium andersoni TaxID=117008 RepID=A0A1J4MGH0_9CRYT|nr:hypothetical protein cand_031360 [Cryptosporidium andersoni]